MDTTSFQAGQWPLYSYISPETQNGQLFPKMSKKTPEVRISANRINDSAPDVNPEFGARVLPAALQFCRCGGLWNAKGHPDGFPSHDPSLRNFRLGRFFDSLIPVRFFGRMISRSNRNSSPGRTNSTILRRLPTSIRTCISPRKWHPPMRSWVCTHRCNGRTSLRCPSEKKPKTDLKWPVFGCERDRYIRLTTQ